MCFSLQRRANFPQTNVQKCSKAEVFSAFLLANVLRATAACHFPRPNFQKRSRNVSFLAFDLQMCFASQQCAIFRHRNFQKCSDAEVFCTFWLENVLRATAACHFSCLLWAATSAPAALASLFFDPANTQNLGKTQHFATSLNFARVDLLSIDFRAIVSSFFWLYFSSLLFIFWLCFSALLFSTVDIVGSETSKLPLTKYNSGTTKYYSVLQSTIPVLLCTTKYYSSTTKYYPSTTKYYCGTTKYHSVLQSITKYYTVLQSITQYYKVPQSTTKYYSVW